MVRGRNIQVSVKGLRPLREPESEIKLPKADLPDLEEELREHLARRPPNTEPQALAAWVTEKERIQFWITLGRAAAVPPKFERVELPPSPTPAPPAPEPLMPAPKYPDRSPEEALDDKVAEIQEAQAQLTGLPTREAFLKRRQQIYSLRLEAGRFAKRNHLESPVFPPMPPDPFRPGKAARQKPGRPPRPQVAPPQQMGMDESSRKSGRLVQPGLDRPYEAAIDLGRAIERHHAAGGRDLEALLSQLQHLQGQVLGITAEAVRMRAEDRAQLLESAANLDALAHQLANYLATGRIEVAA